MMSIFKQVFGNPWYVIITSVAAFAVFTLLVWLPNTELFIIVVLSSSVTFLEKLGIIFKFLSSLQTNFSAFSAASTIVISALFGMNLAMVVYLVRIRGGKLHAGGVAAGVGGFAGGVIGAICISCGALILAPALSLAGVSGIIAFLPFAGQEFGIIGIIALLFSISLVSKNIKKISTGMSDI